MNKIYVLLRLKHYIYTVYNDDQKIMMIDENHDDRLRHSPMQECLSAPR